MADPTNTAVEATPDRVLALAASPSSLVPHWIEIRCRCGIKQIPFRVLAENPRRRGMTVADILLRFRCERCRRKPTSVAMIGFPGGAGQYGAPEKWRVPLIGEEVQ